MKAVLHLGSDDLVLFNPQINQFFLIEMGLFHGPYPNPKQLSAAHTSAGSPNYLQGISWEVSLRKS